MQAESITWREHLGELAAPRCELALTPAQLRLLLGKENYSLFKIASCQLSQKQALALGRLNPSCA